MRRRVVNKVKFVLVSDAVLVDAVLIPLHETHVLLAKVQPERPPHVVPHSLNRNRDSSPILLSELPAVRVPYDTLVKAEVFRRDLLKVQRLVVTVLGGQELLVPCHDAVLTRRRYRQFPHLQHLFYDGVYVTLNAVVLDELVDCVCDML